MAHFTLPDDPQEPISFDLRGETFKVESVPAQFWLRGMNHADLDGAIDALLGEDAERFWSLDPTLGQVESLIEELGKQIGSDAGKSEAPTLSPADTGTPSTRTSDDIGG